MSFSEHIRYTTGSKRGANGFSPSDQAVLRNALRFFLARGGFIAPLALPTSDRVPLLQEYAHRTVALDVIERHNLRSPRVATRFLARCLASSGRRLSINKVANEFKGPGISTSRETLGSLLSYYEQSYGIRRGQSIGATRRKAAAD